MNPQSDRVYYGHCITFIVKYKYATPTPPTREENGLQWPVVEVFDSDHDHHMVVTFMSIIPSIIPAVYKVSFSF
jgi:hypothetical protein